MYTPDNMEHQFTLLTATARHDQLRTRDALAPPADPGADGDEAPEERSAVPLNKNEALERLAVGDRCGTRNEQAVRVGGTRAVARRPGSVSRRRTSQRGDPSGPPAHATYPGPRPRPRAAPRHGRPG